MAIIERTLNIYIFFIEVPNVEVHRQIEIPRAVEVERVAAKVFPANAHAACALRTPLSRS